MKDLRRIGGVAVVLLVLLRISIGWQFLYEGLWKWDTWDTPKPWTSRGFLVNAKGPFRGVFHSMAGDPHDLEWLDHAQPYLDENGEGNAERVPLTEMKWDEWLLAFSYHYDLSDQEYARLTWQLRGRPQATSEPFDWPWDLEEKIPGEAGKIVKIAKVKVKEDGEEVEKSQLVLQTSVIDANQFWHPKRHLVPKNREEMLSLVPDVEEKSPGVFRGKEDGVDESHVLFAEQVDVLYESQSKLTPFEKLRARLFGDPDLTTYDIGAGEERVGKIEQYKRRVAAYEEALAAADTPYEHDVLEYEWKQLQELKSELVGPIKALETEMKDAAYATLTDEQRAIGPMPATPTRQYVSDVTAIWSLIVLGALLILGLLSRFAAVLGAGMVLTFYLVWPPFPGVPEAPGPEHALIVNKNFIEALALLALAAMPTGTWFGVDGLLGRLFGSRGEKKPKPAKATAAKSEPVAGADASKAEVTRDATAKESKPPATPVTAASSSAEKPSEPGSKT